jgi:hypothetical protein
MIFRDIPMHVSRLSNHLPELGNTMHIQGHNLEYIKGQLFGPTLSEKKEIYFNIEIIIFKIFEFSSILFIFYITTLV